MPNTAHSIEHENKNYGFIYWEYGYPTTLGRSRRPESEANTFARENPNLIIQTGYYSLKLDCDDMSLTGFDSLNGSDYMSALNEDVSTHTPATLRLRVYIDDVRYDCTSAIIHDLDNEFVRLIENGQYLQRFDHTGLVFEDSSGNTLSGGRLEVTAWPDRVGFQLDFDGVSDVTRTTIQIITPNGSSLLEDTGDDQAFLAFSPQTQSLSDSYDVSSWINTAYNVSDDEELTSYYSEEETAIHIDLPPSSVSYPGSEDLVDEYIIELNNPTSSEQNLPLVFEQTSVPAVTGTLMVLCHEDGSPLGEPVQISKNWHTTTSTIHQGTWLRGSTMLALAPNETKRLRLRVIYGYWGSVPTASHAQLSLIGHGGNWTWDESALGSWGESLTLDPTQHLAGAFMADVRPTFTTPINTNTTHSWTENSGGLDFLVYYDENNDFRALKKIKTAYKWTGPNITEVHYSGITDDDKIRANYSTTLMRTNDYHRRFFDYKYEFLDDVDPTRLTFLQMGAHYYEGPTFTDFFRGDGDGKTNDYIAEHGGNEYKDSFYFSDRWLATDDGEAAAGEFAKSNRGLLSYNNTLNGEKQVTYMHTYGRTSGEDRCLFELASFFIDQNYSRGDVIEGKVGFIMVPKNSSDYWGDDSEFSGRLSNYSEGWEGAYDEYRYNRSMTVSVQAGTLNNSYPVDITGDNNSSTLAQFTIPANKGIGHIPIIIRDINDDGSTVFIQVNDGSGWQSLDVVSSGVDIDTHNYYQGVKNSSGRFDYSFNVQKTAGLSSLLRVRLIRNE